MFGSKVVKKDNLCKKDLLDTLPHPKDNLPVREWNREDVNLLSAWPLYSFSYRGLEFSFSGMSVKEKNTLFQVRQKQPDLVVLVADREEATAIGYLALAHIHWSRRIVGNFG